MLSASPYESLGKWLYDNPVSLIIHRAEAFSYTQKASLQLASRSQHLFSPPVAKTSFKGLIDILWSTGRSWELLTSLLAPLWGEGRWQCRALISVPLSEGKFEKLQLFTRRPPGMEFGVLLIDAEIRWEQMDVEKLSSGPFKPFQRVRRTWRRVQNSCVTRRNFTCQSRIEPVTQMECQQVWRWQTGWKKECGAFKREATEEISKGTL